MSKAAKTAKPYEFNDYLLTQPAEFRSCLTELRNLIKSITPHAEEVFSYQVHCFKHIYMLVGIGTTRDYCSLYTMSSKLVKQIKEELKGYKMSGMTLHFKPDEPLPVDIITRIVLLRLQENEVIAIGKKKLK
ncbi:MAG: DUF1801 domain-containing protein [Bacteroidetes bacterium]|jgi:uncharacterized protein YdhG (YjbR/CyaY superfamily)|nr:DUF1801 domain-containing protein [Bacteroidota bacterium]